MPPKKHSKLNGWEAITVIHRKVSSVTFSCWNPCSNKLWRFQKWPKTQMKHSCINEAYGIVSIFNLQLPPWSDYPISSIELIPISTGIICLYNITKVNSFSYQENNIFWSFTLNFVSLHVFLRSASHGPYLHDPRI